MSGIPPTKNIGAGSLSYAAPSKINVKTNSLSEIDSARASQKEAFAQAQQAQKMALDTERLARERLDYIKDEYAELGEKEAIRAEEGYSTQRQKGYEALLDLKRQQEREINRTRQLGESQNKELTEHYQDEAHRTVSQGESDIKSQRELFGKMQAYEKSQLDQSRNQSQSGTEMELQSKKEIHDQRMLDLKNFQTKEFERTHETYIEGNHKSQERFEKEFQDSDRLKKDILFNVNSKIASRIHDIKNDALVKLNAYEERNKDPFYKLVDVGADLSETSDEFILTATIPTHEQDHISVFIKGNEVVLNGTRRNEDSFGDENGKRRTSSFQSYTQTFPIAAAVDSKRVQKSFEGDELTVRIPKSFSRNALAQKKPSVERATLDRPEIPKNLPKVESTSEPLNEPELERKIAENKPLI